MTTIIERLSDGIAFYAIDEDGERWELGSATERIQDEGTEDEYRYFSGYFDTKEITFENADDAARIIKKRDHNREIEIYDEPAPRFEEYELEAYIGSENLEDFDLDAIRDALTTYDGILRRTCWKRLSTDEINNIISANEI